MMTLGGKQTIDPSMPVDDHEVYEGMVDSKDAETEEDNAKDRASEEVVMPK